jgi:HTH-type transcriptional regulator / antitoxin HigA
MIAVSDKYTLEVSAPAPITSERQHEEYLSVLDKLASKDNPTNEEEKYAEVLMTLMEAYEEGHHFISDASPVEALRTLMEANDLRQKDLAPVFGSESMVSEVLHKKRGLNRTHIEKLSKRFTFLLQSFSNNTELACGRWVLHLTETARIRLQGIALLPSDGNMRASS